MKKITLSVSDFVALEEELTKGEHCLLAQKLSMTTKYWLNSLLKNIKTETENSNNIKNELIKKWGKEVDGNFSIDVKIKNEEGQDILNPDILKFQEEFLPVLNIEKELEYKEFNIEDFKDVSSEGYYPIFYKLLSIES